MQSKSYDAGQPTPAIRQADGSFILESFRGEEKAYVVTLGPAPSCSCPHFQHRLKELPGAFCKHIAAAEKQAAWLAAVEKARALSDRDLNLCLQKYTLQGDATLTGALRTVRNERKLRAAQGAALKALFS